jgi:protein-tyrosine phosphatase
MNQPLNRRSFLTTALAGGVVLAFDGVALAATPIEASAVRSAPDSLTVDWKGAAGPAVISVASTPYATPRALKRLASAPAGSVAVSAPVSPRPYFLVETKAGQVWTAERLLPLEGGRNFRDMGGYEGAGGKQVRWGKLYRSGVMSGLTPADMAYLSDLGITSICDLRNPDERRADPSPFLGAAKTTVVAFDYEMSSSLAGIARAQTKAAAVSAFADSYMSFLDILTPQYADLFARLVRGEGATTLNCSAGKDRTGVGSALILSALGVGRETVIADYALTQVYTPPANYTAAINSGATSPGLTPEMAQAMRRLPPEVLSVLMGSDPDVMRQTLTRIDAQFGGPVELVKAKFGVNDAGIARMRSLYLV